MIVLQIILGILICYWYICNKKEKQRRMDANPYNTVKSDKWLKEHNNKN